MTLVVDSGLVVAALVDSGPDGTWADELPATDNLAAPHLMPVEVASALRRAAMSGEISTDTASMAHADMLSLRVELFPYEPFATRVWELRDNVTAYDGWYVALAESLGARRATLDLPLSRAAGPRCGFATPRGVLVGGAAMTLAHDTRRTTRDIDAVFEPPASVPSKTVSTL